MSTESTAGGPCSRALSISISGDDKVVTQIKRSWQIIKGHWTVWSLRHAVDETSTGAVTRGGKRKADRVVEAPKTKKAKL